MKSLLLFAFALVCVNSNAQITVFQSDFSNPSDYTVYSSSGTDWVVTGNGPQGTNSQWMGAMNSSTPNDVALFDSDFLSATSATQDAQIEITNSADATGYDYAYVCFQSYYKHNGGEIKMEVSNDGGGTWTAYIIHPSIAVGDSTANPSMELIDVSPVAANQSMVNLRFSYVGTAGYAWMIDDICVLVNTAPIIGLDEQTDEVLTVYPNPAEGKLTIDLHKIQGEAEVQLMDMQGRVIESKTASPSMLTMDMELSGAPGTYFVTVLYDGGQARKRFVKK